MEARDRERTLGEKARKIVVVSAFYDVSFLKRLADGVSPSHRKHVNVSSPRFCGLTARMPDVYALWPGAPSVT